MSASTSWSFRIALCVAAAAVTMAWWSGAAGAEDGLGQPPAWALPGAAAADNPVPPPPAPPPPLEPAAPGAAPAAESPAPESTPPAQPPVPKCDQPLPPPPSPAPAAEVVAWLPCPSECAPPCGVCAGRPLRYVSLAADVFPGLGGTGTSGHVLNRSEYRETAFEFAYTHMDQWEEFDGEGQTGKLDVLRVGLAWRTDPCCDQHWVWRGGFAFFRASGRPSEIDFDFVDIPIPGDYIGGYIGVGYEWDFGARNRWSHGPELQLMGGWEVGEGDFGYTPTIRWGLTYRF